jgi:hypothetical protein
MDAAASELGADFYAALEGATGAAISMPLSQRTAAFMEKPPVRTCEFL